MGQSSSSKRSSTRLSASFDNLRKGVRFPSFLEKHFIGYGIDQPSSLGNTGYDLLYALDDKYTSSSLGPIQGSDLF
jgi:hypothetical protein